LSERVQNGRLVVISGPSGAGKTTVCQRLLEVPGFRRLVTCTTRPPRNGEKNGVDYHFLTPEQFNSKIRAGEFLEYAEVHGYLYGTLREQALDAIGQGEIVLLAIDVQGARSVRNAGIQALTTIFIEPPSMEELERRLARRATETDLERQCRLDTARRELEERVHYDQTVVNDDLDRAVQSILAALETDSRHGSKPPLGR
jgi:guanylate kinase